MQTVFISAKKTQRIVLTQYSRGALVHKKALTILRNFCDKNNANLYLLRGTENLNQKQYALDNEVKDLSIADKYIFNADESCIAENYAISNLNRNPLINAAKLIQNKLTLIIGSPKQTIRVLPYKQNTSRKVAYTTGTISMLEYPLNINGELNKTLHCFGGIYLEYNSLTKKYDCRLLQIKNDELHDLDLVYKPNGVFPNHGTAGIILGDMHFPQQDDMAVLKTVRLINMILPKEVVLHDVASWQTICPHDDTKYLDKILGADNKNYSLRREHEQVVRKLTIFAKQVFPSQVKVVASNHDEFVRKWLNNGEFIKDRINAEFGAELFKRYLKNKHILSDVVLNNVTFLNKGDFHEICGFCVSEHGDAGVNGSKSKGLATYYNSCEKSITGHTHSPQMYGDTFVTGTLSKLKLSYNQKGFTTWAHANVVIYNNGTAQIIFV